MGGVVDELRSCLQLIDRPLGVLDTVTGDGIEVVQDEVVVVDRAARRRAGCQHERHHCRQENPSDSGEPLLAHEILLVVGVLLGLGGSSLEPGGDDQGSDCHDDEEDAGPKDRRPQGAEAAGGEVACKGNDDQHHHDDGDHVPDHTSSATAGVVAVVGFREAVHHHRGDGNEDQRESNHNEALASEEVTNSGDAVRQVDAAGDGVVAQANDQSDQRRRQNGAPGADEARRNVLVHG